MRTKFLGQWFTFSYIEEQWVVPSPIGKILGRPAAVPNTWNDKESVLRNV